MFIDADHSSSEESLSLDSEEDERAPGLEEIKEQAGVEDEEGLEETNRTEQFNSNTKTP